MKKIIFIGLIFLGLTSCKRMLADHSERTKGVKKVCPNCTFIMNTYNGTHYYAVDTSVNPNIIYQVIFKSGGVYYTASDVDHLIRVN